MYGHSLRVEQSIFRVLRGLEHLELSLDLFVVEISYTIVLEVIESDCYMKNY